MSVVEEIFDKDEGPGIVAYRRPVTDPGKMSPKTEDDEYAYHIQDIVPDIAEYGIAHPELISKKAARKLPGTSCPRFWRHYQTNFW